MAILFNHVQSTQRHLSLSLRLDCIGRLLLLKNQFLPVLSAPRVHPFCCAASNFMMQTAILYLYPTELNIGA